MEEPIAPLMKIRVLSGVLTLLFGTTKVYGRLLLLHILAISTEMLHGSHALFWLSHRDLTLGRWDYALFGDLGQGSIHATGWCGGGRIVIQLLMVIIVVARRFCTAWNYALRARRPRIRDDLTRAFWRIPPSDKITSLDQLCLVEGGNITIALSWNWGRPDLLLHGRMRTLVHPLLLHLTAHLVLMQVYCLI
jgi:hypothetical protein